MLELLANSCSSQRSRKKATTGEQILSAQHFRIVADRRRVVGQVAPLDIFPNKVLLAVFDSCVAMVENINSEASKCCV